MLTGALRWPLRAGAFLVLALLLSACGGGQPPEPSAEEVQEAEDVLRGQEQQVADGVQEALATLQANLANIDPCAADPSQITALYEPMVILQQTGDQGDAYTGPIADALRPVVRAMARAFARGDLPGVTREDVVNRAREVGIDIEDDDWMVDEQCERHWRMDLDWNMTIPPPVPVTLEHSGSLDFSVVEGRPFSAGGSIDVSGVAGSLGGGCTVNIDVPDATFEVSGEHRLEGNLLVMDIHFGGGSGSGQAVCGGVTLPIPFNFSDLYLPAEMQANDGQTYTSDWSVPGGSGELSLTLHLLD